MKKSFGLSCSFIGTVIGAGFATGREIRLYFADCSLFSVILSGIFIGFFCFVFLSVSSKFGDIFSAFGFLKMPLKIFAFISNFCVLCATLAGSDSVIYSLFSLPCGSIVTAIICLICVLFGFRLVKNANLLIIPIIFILILVVFFRDKRVPLIGQNSIVRPFAYASMNMLTGGFLIGCSSPLSEKECIATSVISGTILTVLLVFIYSATKYVSAGMPFIEKADALGLGIVGHVILYLSMLTTIIGALSVCAGKSKIAAVIITCLALLVSPFGFSFIVDTLYPIIGALGSAVTLLTVFIYLLSLLSSRCYTLLFRQDGSLFRRRSRRVAAK